MSLSNFEASIVYSPAVKLLCDFDYSPFSIIFRFAFVYGRVISPYMLLALLVTILPFMFYLASPKSPIS